MLPNEEEIARPHRTRRKHQEAIAKRHRRRQRRRRRRAGRIRMWRTLISLGFWIRASIGLVCLAFLTFWAKFAVVYNIPTDIQKGHMYGVQAYVGEKSWWFGPVAFDLNVYSENLDPVMITLDPTTGLIESLGKYQTILENPRMVWLDRAR